MGGEPTTGERAGGTRSEAGDPRGPLPQGVGRSDEPRILAPWTLEGEGFVVVSWLPRAERERLAPPGFDGRACHGPLSVTMLLDYRRSDAGPYKELLFIPGRFDADGRVAWSIARIWVSTRASVVNGRANWGIPKVLARFEVAPQGARGERWAVEDEVGPVARFDLERGLLPLPIAGGLVPAPLRTLVQRLDGRTFVFAPTATGLARRARLLRATTLAPERFPDLGLGRSVAAHASFEMRFPVAEVR